MLGQRTKRKLLQDDENGNAIGERYRPCRAYQQKTPPPGRVMKNENPKPESILVFLLQQALGRNNLLLALLQLFQLLPDECFLLLADRVLAFKRLLTGFQLLLADLGGLFLFDFRFPGFFDYRAFFADTSSRTH